MSLKPDFFDAVYNYINHILIHQQNGLTYKPGIFGEDSAKNLCIPRFPLSWKIPRQVYLFSVDISKTLNQEPPQFKRSKSGGSCSWSKDSSEALKPNQMHRKPKQDNRRKVLMLRSLLRRCVEEVNDKKLVDAHRTLKIIRERSSVLGDHVERLAHYTCNAIEARIAGSGTTLYAGSCEIRMSDILKAYQTYFMAVPFERMSNIFANKSIYKQTMRATRIHIVDFGISYGFQWPSIIQALSLRPGGPPKLRITGIDLPHRDSSQMVETTGYRLAQYCKRFNVPFEYNGIAKKWDSIKLEDIKIDKEETIVVNCLYSLRHISNELILGKYCNNYGTSPRDIVLNLIKRINPEIFVHGILSSDHNCEDLPLRFDGAWLHFSDLFNILETTLTHDYNSRMVLEQEMVAMEVMNVIACEGSTRIERPQRYRWWMSVIQKLGFKQLQVDKEILEEVEAKMLQYHKNFTVYESMKWMVQGWNGRVIYVLSLWKPGLST